MVVVQPALAEVSELEARLGLDAETLTGADLARAKAALADASALVRDEARREFTDDDGNLVVPDAVRRVVLGAALRTYRNPEGELSQTVGPFRRDLKASEVGVYLTDAERDIVRRYRPTPSGGVWSLSYTRDGDDVSDTLWLDDSYGFEPFPIGSVSQPWK